MVEWNVVGVVSAGNRIHLNGVNPWDYSWRLVNETPVELPHPCYANQQHHYFVYEVDSDIGTIRFAAGELSANVWGFYVPGNSEAG